MSDYLHNSFTTAPNLADVTLRCAELRGDLALFLLTFHRSNLSNGNVGQGCIMVLIARQFSSVPHLIGFVFDRRSPSKIIGGIVISATVQMTALLTDGTRAVESRADQYRDAAMLPTVRIVEPDKPVAVFISRGFEPSPVLAFGTRPDRAVRCCSVVWKAVDASIIEGEIEHRIVFNSPQQRPRALLRDSNFGSQPDRGNIAILLKQHKSNNKFMKRNVRPLKDRASPNREIQFTGVTAIVAVLTGGDSLAAFTGWTNNAVRPQSGFQIEPRGFLVWDQFKQLKRAYGAFAHKPNLLKICQGVKYIIPKVNKRGLRIPFA